MVNEGVMALDRRSFTINYSILVTETSPYSAPPPPFPLGDFMTHGFSERVNLSEFPKKSLQKYICILQSYGP